MSVWKGETMKEYSRREVRQLLRFWVDGEAEIEPERLRYFVAQLLGDEGRETEDRDATSAASAASPSSGAGGPRVGFDDLVDQLSNPEILQKVVIRGFRKAWGPSSGSEAGRN